MQIVRKKKTGKNMIELEKKKIIILGMLIVECGYNTKENLPIILENDARVLN